MSKSMFQTMDVNQNDECKHTNTYIWFFLKKNPSFQQNCPEKGYYLLWCGQEDLNFNGFPH